MPNPQTTEDVSDTAPPGGSGTFDEAVERASRIASSRIGDRNGSGRRLYGYSGDPAVVPIYR